MLFYSYVLLFVIYMPIPVITVQLVISYLNALSSVIVTYRPLCRELWVRIARKVCWLTYCTISLHVVEHRGIFGILHLTYYVLGHAKSFSGILYSMVV